MTKKYKISFNFLGKSGTCTVSAESEYAATVKVQKQLTIDRVEEQTDGTPDGGLGHVKELFGKAGLKI